MKQNILTIIHNLKKSVKRFPVTIIISCSLLVSMITLFETALDSNTELIEKLTRTNMTLGIGLVLSACLKLLSEGYFNEDKRKTIGSNIIGGISLILFYAFIVTTTEYVPVVRFVALLLALLVAFFFIPKLKSRKSIEIHAIKVFNGFFTTLVYSAVLFLGLAAILFTVNTLFDLNIDGKYYFYIFLTDAFVFAVPHFLSKIPQRMDSFDNYRYSRSLKVLLLYIVIPLVSVYTAILYAYFAKILITWQWPNGLVSHLVLWYSAISVGVIFLLSPILNENFVAKAFKKYFPIANIPLLCMMFASIGIRINQYGFTENRYFVVLLGIWILFVMTYYIVSKGKFKNEVILMTLSALIFVSSYGPLSAFSFSVDSQNDRLLEVLEENNMIKEGEIIKSEDISVADQKAINSIIHYFNEHHTIDDVEILPDNFVLNDMEDVFGFPYEYDYAPEDIDYYFYHVDLFDEGVDVKGYDYLLNLNSWDVDEKTTGRYSIRHDSDNSSIIIDKEGSTVMEIDLLDLAESIKQDNQKNRSLPVSDMTFEKSNEDISVKVIFTNINLIFNKQAQSWKIDSFEMIMLLNVE